MNTQLQKLSEVKHLELREEFEQHSVPFGALAVEVLRDRALVEALRRFYEPEALDSGNEHNSLYDMFFKSTPKGKAFRVRSGFDACICVQARIVLDYPLNEAFVADIEFNSDELGCIFEAAYEMYCQIYALDDSHWQSEGWQDKAPSISNLNPEGPKIANRARGKYIWGHDMSDLFFEGVRFRPVADWPQVNKRQPLILEIGEPEPTDEEFEKRTQRIAYQDISEADFSSLKHDNFIGEFRFEIGS